MAAANGGKKRAAAAARSRPRSEEPRKKSAKPSTRVPVKGRPKQNEWRLQMQPELIDQAPDPSLWLSSPVEVSSEPEPESLPLNEYGAEPPSEPTLGEPAPEQPEDSQAVVASATTPEIVGDANQPRSDSWNLTEVEEQPFSVEFGIHPQSWSLRLKLAMAVMILTIVGCGIGITFILPNV